MRQQAPAAGPRCCRPLPAFLQLPSRAPGPVRPSGQVSARPSRPASASAQGAPATGGDKDRSGIGGSASDRQLERRAWAARHRYESEAAGHAQAFLAQARNRQTRRPRERGRNGRAKHPTSRQPDRKELKARPGESRTGNETWQRQGAERPRPEGPPSPETTAVALRPHPPWLEIQGEGLGRPLCPGSEGRYASRACAASSAERTAFVISPGQASFIVAVTNTALPPEDLARSLPRRSWERDGQDALRFLIDPGEGLI